MKREVQRMRMYFLIASLVGIYFLIPDSSQGYSIYKTELRDKYDLRSVSCFTCHVPIAIAPAGAYNKFGRLFLDELADKGMDDAVAAAVALPRDDPERIKIESEIRDTFLAALEEIASKEQEDGVTYGAAIKAGSIDGIRLRE